MPSTAVDIEPDQIVWYQKSVPALFALLIVLSFVGTFVYKLRFDGIFACPASGYGTGAYLSDCTARTYGDYDHGAFWFGLEPPARRAAADADVLLIGNSRLQFALSGKAAARWFSASNIHYYLLGFSHSETVVFTEPLLSKIRPRAKAYVINVDRFFDERVSPPMEQIFQGGDIQQRYEHKRTWQTLHNGICNALPIACGNATAVFRTRATGTWRRLGSGRFEPKQVSDGPPSKFDQWDEYARLGVKFLARLPVDQSCVILTIVPTVETKRVEAMAIAAKLGHDLLVPQIDDLRTFDGSHLDEASAERWSEAFLREAGPQIRRCVDAMRASPG
jgi:hypothetical protein